MSATVPLPKPPGAHSAREAGLFYASDADPGIARVKIGRAFAYRGVDGRPVRDRATLARIRALVIPPAWTESCGSARSADGHIQATGRDARGRKQYRYHARWGEARDTRSTRRCLPSGRCSGRFAPRRADLRALGLSRDNVLATVVRSSSAS